MKREFVCVVCPAGCHLVWEDGGVFGYSCDRGLKYATDEITAPKRHISSTVVIKGSALHRRLPVKTGEPIDRTLLVEAAGQLDGVVVTAPVNIGDTVLKNVLGTGVDFVAARSIR